MFEVSFLQQPLAWLRVCTYVSRVVHYTVKSNVKVVPSYNIIVRVWLPAGMEIVGSIIVRVSALSTKSPSEPYTVLNASFLSIPLI